MPRLKKESFYNRSLERALKILCAFQRDNRTFTLSELSKILGLPKATILRLCSTLLKYHFLGYNAEAKQYSLGLKLFELGGIVYSSFSVRRVASPYLSQLQSRLGKTAFLGILQDGQLLYIDKKEDLQRPIRFASDIGTYRPPHFGMLGHTLMAYLNDEEVDRIIEKNPLRPFTRKSIKSVEAFKERLRKIRRQGFYIDKEEALDGVTGIGAPVRDFTGKVVAAVGVGFISSSEDSKGLTKIIREVVRTSQTISYELGYIERNPTPNMKRQDGSDGVR
jgi:IclR family KDG regulon transcriptional repressor